MDRKRNTDSRAYRDKPFEYDFEFNEQEGEQKNYNYSEVESVPYLKNDNRLMDRIAEFRKTAGELRQDSLNISQDTPDIFSPDMRSPDRRSPKKKANKAVQRGLKFSQYHSKRSEKSPEKSPRSNARSSPLKEANFEYKSSPGLKESEVIGNSKEYKRLEEYEQVYSPTRSVDRKKSLNRLNKFTSYIKQSSFDSIKQDPANYTSSPNTKDKASLERSDKASPIRYDKASPERYEKKLLENKASKPTIQIPARKSYTPAKSIQENNFNDQNTEFITISKAEGKTVQTM